MPKLFSRTKPNTIERAIEEAAHRVLFYWNPNGDYEYGGVSISVIDADGCCTRYEFEDGTIAQVERWTELDGKRLSKRIYRKRKAQEALIDTCQNGTDRVFTYRRLVMHRPNGAYISYTEAFRLALNPGDTVANGGLFVDENYDGCAEGGTEHWDVEIIRGGDKVAVLNMLADFAPMGRQRAQAALSKLREQPRHPRHEPEVIAAREGA